MNEQLRSESFNEFVAAHFASKIIKKLSNSETEEADVLKERAKRLLVAKSKSAMADATKFPAQGNWSKARTRGLPRSDRGFTNGDLY